MTLNGNIWTSLNVTVCFCNVYNGIDGMYVCVCLARERAGCVEEEAEGVWAQTKVGLCAPSHCRPAENSPSALCQDAWLYEVGLVECVRKFCVSVLTESVQKTKAKGRHI